MTTARLLEKLTSWGGLSNTSMTRVLWTATPAGFVTDTVKAVVASRGGVATGTPLEIEPRPPTSPLPPEKTAVSCAVPPGLRAAGAAVKLEISGAGYTKTVQLWWALSPQKSASVRISNR